MSLFSTFKSDWILAGICLDILERPWILAGICLDTCLDILERPFSDFGMSLDILERPFFDFGMSLDILERPFSDFGMYRNLFRGIAGLSLSLEFLRVIPPLSQIRENQGGVLF